jgi:transposase
MLPKKKLDCMLLDTSSGKMKSKSISNTPAGFATSCWNGWSRIKHQSPRGDGADRDVSRGAALALADAGLVVSLVNPAQLRVLHKGWASKQDRQG